MTREQKNALAMAIVSAAANIFENWDDNVTTGYQQGLAGIDVFEAQNQVSKWLGKLPTGGMWDVRLPDPDA
jgi:hypothetical protein